ncbi:thiamine-phosphate kinase [Actinomycetaceae bacterium WB03_NA08]|uniref:Thiamine-monophosphate kinase n=2 Tax=Scrofimicrobium canadense TaxID=2652290 RepID=A0A6N7W2L1_9ACTO|nr:thiamine-phosphate kinase [Scrofimicrobium canadense]
MPFRFSGGPVKVKDMSEESLLAAITPLLPRGEHTILGPGDDCAVIEAPGGSFVVTTDVLVQDQHFRTQWSSGFDIGARAAAQNLADVAAMGAVPTGMVVSMVLPGDTEVSWVEDCARGLASYNIGVVGGDLSGGSYISISVTAFGSVEGPAVTRGRAAPGQTLALAGTLGLSLRGFEALTEGKDDPAIDVFRVPRPPLEAGPIAAKAGATAMMDVSDGLVRDAARIAKASQVLIELDPALLDAYVAEAGTIDRVLYGGEDHSLLAVFPSDRVPDPFQPIGKVSAGQPGVVMEGKRLTGGWDHFA